MKSVVVFLFATLLPTQAESFRSVWEQSKQEAYAFEGVVKTIFVDEDNDRITVRIKPIDSERSAEDFRVCNNNVQSARNQRFESDKMSLIRQAFATGTPVRIGFSGSFDRCLSSIQYLKAEDVPQQVGI